MEFLVLFVVAGIGICLVGHLIAGKWLIQRIAEKEVQSVAPMDRLPPK